MSDLDAARVLSALRQIPEESLRQAAALLPAPLAAQLEALRDVTRADDPEAALRRVTSRLQADPDALRALLQVLGKGLRSDSLRLGEALAEAEGTLTGVAELRDHLERAAQRDDLAETLGPRLRRLLGDLGSLPESLQAAVGDLGGLVEGMADAGSHIAGGLTPDISERLDRALRGVDRAQGAVADATARLGAALPVLDELADLAPDHPAAVRLRLAAAAIAAELRGPEAGRPRWRAALEAAARRGDVEAAVLAGRWLQLDALERHALDDAIAAAATVGRVASQAGALRPAVLSSLELALLHAHRGAHAEARRLADRAERAAAAADRALHARAWLTSGQVAELAGDLPAARAASARVLDMAKDDRSFPREVAQAALRLGRLQADHQPRFAVRSLQLALQLGGALRDEELVAQAALHLCAVAPEDGPRWWSAARRVLSADAVRALGRALVERHGEERVARWLVDEP
jgi:hypothetical protein